MTQVIDRIHSGTGRALAERLGYPARWLDAVPPAALDSFAGVGHLLDLAALRPGESVLDLGSGSGTDAFIAAHLVGHRGRVIGVDTSDARLAKARGVRDEAGVQHVAFVQGLIEEPGGFDVVIANGVVDHAIIAAAARALRPGGRLAIADSIKHDEAIEAAGLVVDVVRANPGVTSVTVLATKPS